MRWHSYIIPVFKHFNIQWLSQLPRAQVLPFSFATLFSKQVRNFVQLCDLQMTVKQWSVNGINIWMFVLTKFCMKYDPHFVFEATNMFTKAVLVTLMHVCNRVAQVYLKCGQMMCHFIKNISKCTSRFLCPCLIHRICQWLGNFSAGRAISSSVCHIPSLMQLFAFKSMRIPNIGLAFFLPLAE